MLIKLNVKNTNQKGQKKMEIVENMQFEENPSRRVYNVDIDGTLTNGEKFWEQEPTVNKAMKDFVVEKYKQGNIIIAWTARQWSTAPLTVGWLIKNEIPFHGIMMGRGGSDYYIDDKATKPEEAIAGNLNIRTGNLYDFE